MTLFEKKPEANLILEPFFNDLKNAPPEKRLLMLDYDGTLAPFRIEREQAVPYSGVREILNRLILSKQTQVVIISGRAIADLIPLLGLKELPEIWGSHGLERRFPDGTGQKIEIDPSLRELFTEVKKWADQKGWGERCEVKPGSTALHWRGLSEPAQNQMKKAFLDAWAPPARRQDLLLKNFDGGIEIRLPGVNKGDAVRILLREKGKGAVAAYLGDDLTDEDAFHALRGKGLAVLVRKEFRPTAAALHLVPPEELLEFLSRWLNHLIF